jgi:predicted RNA-binding Zn-ribbon protein involved in translation (DUF1610 family)
MKTAEEWLHRAVELMDESIFNGELNTSNHKFQIYFGRIKGKKGTETVQPSDNEDITLDDFFPTTIGVDYTTKQLDQLLANLAYECIKAFFGVTKGKRFKKLAQEYNFEAPFGSAHPSYWLTDQLEDVRKSVEKELGEFPWKPIKFPTKPQKEKKKTTVNFFCPSCGNEMYSKVKMFEKYKTLPTCGCGSKMGIAQDAEDQEENI